MFCCRSLTGVLLLALTTAGSTIACNGPQFVKTSKDFVPTPRGRYPSVYLDRQPERPYQSVGIIQAQGRLSDVISAVKEKGKEVGCDLIVDRRIHKVSEADAHPVLTWVIPVGLPGHAPEPLVDHPRRATHTAGSLLAYPVPYIIPTPAATAPESHEFICGVFVEQAGGNAGAQAQAGAAIPSSQALWEVFATETRGYDPCPAVAKVLEKEAACSGAQCVGPLVLSRAFLSRCEEVAPAEIVSVQKHLDHWRTESAAHASGPCFGILLRATRSRGAAIAYRQQCLANREGGYVETSILERAAKTHAGE